MGNPAGGRGARTDPPEPPCSVAPLRAGVLQLEWSRRRATLAGRPLALSPREFRLLEILMERPGRPVARTALAASVWGSVRGVTSMDYVVAGLRRALRTAASAAGVVAPTIERVPPGRYRLPA